MLLELQPTCPSHHARRRPGVAQSAQRAARSEALDVRGFTYAGAHGERKDHCTSEVEDVGERRRPL